MIRVYYLLVELINNAETVRGVNIIHDALLLTTPDPSVRLLIMDTTPEEHTQLTTLTGSFRDALPQEIELYNSQIIITPPDPDTIRVQELLATSPSVITQPEMWELMRIIGRRLGYIKNPPSP